MTAITKDSLALELTEVQNIIKNRKNEALNLNIIEKVREIAYTLGTYSDYGGGEYHYHEKGLTIGYYSYHSSIKVDLGHGERDVFKANIEYSAKPKINLYIPGKWTKRIKELYEQTLQVKKDVNLADLKENIRKLCEKWDIQPLWKNNKKCPNCGKEADPKITCNEFGYSYCSDACAKEYVNANFKEE